MQPLVSIITPAYNSEKFVLETLRSVQNQTYSNWELIVVDDCSTDKTVAIVNSFLPHESRIKLIQLSKNSGTGIARNTALNNAKGKYITFLDADDLWKPKKLEKQIHFLETNKLKFTFSFYDCINEEGADLEKTIQAPKNLTYRQLFFCNFIGNLTAIYDSDFLGKIPISTKRKRQDWILWLQVLKSIKTAKPVPESLALYRIRNNSISASKLDLVKHNFNVYRDYHKFNFGISCLCMIGFLFTQFFVKPQFVKKTKKDFNSDRKS